MNVKVLGTGCKNCKVLEENVRKAVEEMGIEVEIEKVEDIQDIMNYGVMGTPALVVNGEVKSAGRVLKPKDIIKLLK